MGLGGHACRLSLNFSDEPFNSNFSTASGEFGFTRRNLVENLAFYSSFFPFSDFENGATVLFSDSERIERYSQLIFLAEAVAWSPPSLSRVCSWHRF